MPTRPDPTSGDRAPRDDSWLQRLTGRWRGAAPAEGAAPLDVLDALPDPVLTVDASGRVLSANRAVQTVLGHDPDALAGEAAEALVAPADRDDWRARLAGQPRSRRPLAVVAGDGAEVPCEVTVAPVDGRPVFAVTLRDVRAAQEAEASLEASESRRRTLHTIVDTIPDPVVAVDRTGRVVLRNGAARRLAGPDSDDRAALPAEALREADDVMRTGVAVHDHEEPGAAGGVQLTTRVPVHDRAGAVVGLVAISRDVTAQRVAEAQLLADKRAAEQAAHANREFLATTSHEVRTLMSGVTGMTTLLLGTDLDDEQREFVDTIRSSGAALLTVINDVLDFSKIEAGMLALESEPFAVGPAVEEALRMVAQQAAAKGLDLAWRVDPGVPETVRGDAARVRQVLLNLLSNAVKFTDAGHVRVRVSLAEAASPDGAGGTAPDGAAALAFTVEDTGVGIAPDRLGAIFERFEQADASTARTHGGTGLGLAICRRLVQMMGGTMSAESVLGEGSAFRFTLAERDPAEADPTGTEPGEARQPHAPTDAEPRDPAPLAEAAGVLSEIDGEPMGDGVATDDVPLPRSAPEPASESEPDGAGPGVVMSMDAMLPTARVLLAEDNPVNQRVTVLTLRRLGYQPDVVPDGAKAVFAVRNRPYDVVLMDVMMPVMDGLEATRQIRADPGRYPAPAIVALTANALDGDRQRCLAAGCDDYVAKPVAPEFLAATIERTVREKGTA